MYYKILIQTFARSGGSAKTLLIVHLCPNVTNLSETLSTLNFAARARNMMLSLGSQDTIKKWRDAVCSYVHRCVKIDTLQNSFS